MSVPDEQTFAKTFGACLGCIGGFLFTVRSPLIRSRLACRLLQAALLFIFPTASLLGQAVNVPTWRYDNTEQGQNTQETILTPSNVNTNTFGKLFSQTVDGNVYAQPLYISNLAINGGTHNVIFVATEHDSVYAFDADSNGGANSAPLWQASMINTLHGAPSGATTVPSSDVQSGTGDIHPEIGITGTPVIDVNAQTIFLVAKSKENGNYVQRLHALNILNGSERTGSPVVLTATVPGNGNGSSGGTLTFSSLWQNNRPALVLFNGNVYIGFSSHGDDGPWHGWMLVYNETSLQQTAAVCLSPNGLGSGIWSSGAGFPIDTVSPNGRAFLATGNGDLTTYPPLTNNVDYGDSILRYDLSNNGFAISDAFTTFNQAALNGADTDLGSGGVLMLPDQPGPYPHLLVQVGKEGRIVVLNRDKLNGYVGPSAGSNTNALQDITGALKTNQGLWSTPAYWNGSVYMAPAGDFLKVFPLTNGTLATTAAAESPGTFGFPGASPVISSNGTQNGILWGVETDEYSSNGPAILHAYNAENLGQELYNSNQNPTRDNPGQAMKFAVPVVTNGKVYVGTGAAVNVFGLLQFNQQAAAPAISPSGGTYGTAQQITLTDSTSGSIIYYTIDGSTPTASSTKYTAPFTLSTDTTLQAIASASGYLQSAVTTATYTFTSQAVAPQFSPAAGSFTSAQNVTITDTTPNATIYYTTDGSTPTTSSAKYTAPIPVTSTTIISAIAAASGLANSSVTSGSYLIQVPGTSINYSTGFASVAGLTLNGSATNVDDSRLQLTTGVAGQTGTVFFNTPTNIQAFTTDFAFQLSNAQADGYTFTIQNVGPTALGGGGGSLGYANIPKSVAVKFDFYSNSGEGTDSTGLYLNGAAPTVPAVDMTSSGVFLNSGDTIDAHITYDGANLTMTLTDIVVNKMFTYTWPVNIPGTVGSNVAYIGFTGASGGQTASQKILNWTFSSQTTTVTQTPAPTFTPLSGTFSSAQSVAIADGTTGAVIYYTTDGSNPTTSSAVYKSPISVSSGTVTIHAIAQASGQSVSSVSSASYTIQPVTATATPTFTPASGTYTSAQSVTISDPGATIYYTTNGTTPTTSSTLYGGAIPVTATTTIEAIAVAAGSTVSNVASATYVIQSGAPSTINFAGGFSGATGLQLNGSAKLNAANLELTDGGVNEAASAYWTAPVNIQAFTTNFSFQLASAQADGFTFTIQKAGVTALGSNGGALGYGGIGTSVAVKFDIYSNNGEGTDSTGVFTNGASPTVPAVSLTSSGITLASGDTIAAQLVYNGTTLTLNLTDTVTGNTFTQSFTVNIPSIVGASTAYVGFTGGTGGQTAIQNIKSWTFNSTTTPTAAEPGFSPSPGTYTVAQNVTLTSATPNATIYYTVDGSTPTHSSAAYSAPIVVSGASLTIRAFAAATSYLDSPIVVGTYQIQAPATVATPVISPASGTTFASSLSVSITDTTTNAVIYYTTDGSTPTANSAKYSGAFNVTSTTVVHALATASGLTNSSVAAASYTLVPTVTATPVISPASGTSFGSSLSVSITDATTNATIYYTTDGSTPGTSSTKYSGAFNITSSTVVNALAIASGMANSSVATASYTLVPAGTAINYSGGFASTAGLTLNGSATNAGGASLELTNGGTNQAGSAFYNTLTNIQAFTTDFTFQLVNPQADGFTFVIQNSALNALGGSGGGLGYGPSPGGNYPSIPNSVALKFDIYSNSGEGTDSTGVFVNGAIPTVPAVDMTASGVILTSGHTMAAHITYDGTNLVLTLTDTVLNKVFTQSFPVNIPSTIGSNVAYIGFGGGTGGGTVTQKILTWTFTPQSGSVTQTPAPTFSPAGGTYTSAQSVTINDSGATIYYTTDGSTPTTSSAVYKSAISVSSGTVTVKAIAQVTGDSVSSVSSATYTIQPVTVTATPTFTPVAGTYSSAQSVTIADSTTGAVIYYTTDGSTPTTSSAIYKSAISVSSGTVTVKAIAQATGDTVSTVGSAAYTIQALTATATPVISPASGTSFASSLSVSITDATTNATIYYTTDGSTPGTSSTKYSGAFNITSSTVVHALAIASGMANSSVATASYTLVPAGTAINYSGGFASTAGLTLNGSATNAGGASLELTNGAVNQAGSAFYNTLTNIQAFTTDFTFQLVNPQADGFTFVIQNSGLNALGGSGGGLGYGPSPGGNYPSIPNSVALKFDIYSNSGEGTDSTGVFVNGAIPTVPAVDMTASGVILTSGHTMAAHITYDGTNLVLTLTDTVLNKVFTQSFPVNIPSTIGSNVAYIGFGGGTGGGTATQKILTWTFTP